MALGIPDRFHKESIPHIAEPKMMELVVQAHNADKAGPHFDLRFVDKESNKAYSFAGKHLPTTPGEKTQMILQPLHTAAYAAWTGTIEKGNYGAGTVALHSQDDIEITKSDPEHITFNVYKPNGDTNKFALIRTEESKPDQFLFYNVTPTRASRPYVPKDKPHYKSLDINNLATDNLSEIFSPKIDGAQMLAVLRAGKPIETYSYRESRRDPNKLIDHSFRTQLYRTIVPKGLKGTTVVRGELFNEDPKLTTPLLISNVLKSRADQYATKDPLKSIIFDVVQYEGKDYTNRPYSEKLEALKRISATIPQLKMPTLYRSPEEKQQFIDRLKNGTHPETKEGLVIYDLNKSVPQKSKLVEDYDVHIKSIFPGEGKYSGTHAGGFTYAHSPEGPTAGRVGTGFSDSERIDMLRNPQNYIGRIARLVSQEKLKSSALRAPVFSSMRPD